MHKVVDGKCQNCGKTESWLLATSACFKPLTVYEGCGAVSPVDTRPPVGLIATYICTKLPGHEGEHTWEHLFQKDQP